MKKSLLAFTLASVLPASLLLLTPDVASAQELADRKGPLEGAPAVRQRAELLAQRFEMGAGLGSSLAADFYNALLVNLRLAFHLNDWLAISGTLGHNLTPDFKTGLTDNLEKSLKARMADDRAPSAENALGSMNKMSQVFGLHAEITPITGKLSLFGKWFAAYDVYALAGLGGANFAADKDECAMPAAASCPDVGTKLGGSLGLGMHAFIKDFLAVNLEVKDVVVNTNRAGQDVNADSFVDDKDHELTHNYILGLNLTVFFPTMPKISD